jgi:peptide/nickel transport system substrate-binding protein
MRPIALPWIAGISAFLVVAVADAARRPYYGGTLRIEIRARIRTLDPTAPASDPMEFAAKSFLAPFVLAAPLDASPAGSGPFKLARWDPGKGATLVANDDYPGGRPYLDSIELQMGRDLKDQALDFSLGRADITETGERKGPLVNTLALVFDNDRASASLREALSLSIDRETIQKVLLRDQGEPTHALLPEWFSGYAFLFDKPRDLSRAHDLAGFAPSLTFLYDRQDATIRRIAERIALNAMDAGISLRPVTAANADVRLELLRVAAKDELSSLQNVAALLAIPFPAAASPYEAERSLLYGFRVIPILHLADSWAVSPRVHNWPDLANVWINP